MTFFYCRSLSYLIVLSLIVLEILSENVVSSIHHSEVNDAINTAIDEFEVGQKKKMTAGFTSEAKRSYKKTKLYEMLHSINVFCKAFVLIVLI